LATNRNGGMLRLIAPRHDDDDDGYLVDRYIPAGDSATVLCRVFFPRLLDVRHGGTEWPVYTWACHRCCVGSAAGNCL